MDVIIVHRFPESHQYNITDVWEGTDLSVIITFHFDQLAILGYISSLVLPETPSLCTVGNIITGMYHQIQLAIDAGMLSVLPQVLMHPKSSIQKERAWALVHTCKLREKPKD